MERTEVCARGTTWRSARLTSRDEKAANMNIDQAAYDAVAALWRATRNAEDAGTMTRELWVTHLRAEAALAAQDDRIDLEAVLTMGLRLRFIESPEQIPSLLAT